MIIKNGNDDLKEAWHGDKELSHIYVGDNLVWEKETNYDDIDLNFKYKSVANVGTFIVPCTTSTYFTSDEAKKYILYPNNIARESYIGDCVTYTDVDIWRYLTVCDKLVIGHNLRSISGNYFPAYNEYKKVTILRNDGVINVEGYEGHMNTLYVPSNLLDGYKNHPTWSKIARDILPIE